MCIRDRLKQVSSRYSQLKIAVFWPLSIVERSEKLSENTACDVNVGQVKKSGKFKQSFSSLLGAEVVCVAINLERTRNLSSKVASCGYNLLII